MATPIGARFEGSVLDRARDVRVLLTDIDGVWTDGGLWFDSHGEHLKRFHTLDGHGVGLLAAAGVALVVISGRDSAPLRHRLQALQVTRVHLGVTDKRLAGEQALAALGMSWSVAAAIGDDWPDLAMMRPAALAMAPPGAHAEVLACAHHVCRAPAGAGAFREACDLILTAIGAYDRLLKEAAP